ncbi:MAG: hypothetical protein SGARI_006648, partial [Bacillariaceae sp.]
TILVDFDNGETFDGARPNGYTNSQDDEIVVKFLGAYDDAIAFFGYAYLFSQELSLSAARIQNADGEFVAPDAAAVADGTYNPLARRIFMNLLSDEEALVLTAPFIEFGLSNEGSALVDQTGYIAIPDPDKEEMLARVSGEGESPTDAPTESGAVRMASATVSGLVAAVMMMLLV